MLIHNNQMLNIDLKVLTAVSMLDLQGRAVLSSGQLNCFHDIIELFSRYN